MTQKLIVLLLGLLLFISACKESTDDPVVPQKATLQLNVDLQYDGAPAIMFQPYSLNDSVRVLFSRFSMYLTDVQVVNNSGDPVTLEEVGFHNLTDQYMDLQSASEGYVLEFSDLEPGEFSMLRFGLGLPSDLNAQEPGDFEMGHPLNAPEEYWIGWQSYVFVKIEGKIDSDDNPDEFEGNMALHLGGDEIFRQIELSEPIVLEGGKTAVVDMTIDLQDMFRPSGKDPYNLLSRPMIHATSHLPQANELADNLVGAIR